MNFFESPYVAVLLGAIYGFSLMAAYGVIALRFTGDKAVISLYGSVLLSAFGLIVTVGILLLYRAFASEGLIWFGASMAFGFIVGLVFITLRLVRKKM